MDSCSSCLASAKRCHLVPSSPTDPNLRTCPHAPASPVRAHSCVISLWVCECQHWVGIRHQRNQNVTKRCKTSIQRASLTAPLQYCMWYHSFLCVRKCVECRLWKELEALQHQKSVGMHPLSTHTHSSHPCAHLTPHAKAPNRENKATCHCSPHFW